MPLSRSCKKLGIKPDYTAGHSLGEYTALVASGAISFEDAVYTVRKRGEFIELRYRMVKAQWLRYWEWTVKLYLK